MAHCYSEPSHTFSQAAEQLRSRFLRKPCRPPPVTVDGDWFRKSVPAGGQWPHLRPETPLSRSLRRACADSIFLSIRNEAVKKQSKKSGGFQKWSPPQIFEIHIACG